MIPVNPIFRAIISQEINFCLNFIKNKNNEKKKGKRGKRTMRDFGKIFEIDLLIYFLDFACKIFEKFDPYLISRRCHINRSIKSPTSSQCRIHSFFFFQF